MREPPAHRAHAVEQREAGRRERGVDVRPVDGDAQPGGDLGRAAGRHAVRVVAAAVAVAVAAAASARCYSPPMRGTGDPEVVRARVAADDPDRAIAALADALGPAPSLLFVFASWRLDPDAVAAALDRRFPGV